MQKLIETLERFEGHEAIITTNVGTFSVSKTFDQIAFAQDGNRLFLFEDCDPDGDCADIPLQDVLTFEQTDEDVETEYYMLVLKNEIMISFMFTI